MKRKPLKFISAAYDPDGYAQLPFTGIEEFGDTNTIDASHIEQDAIHRFVTDIKTAEWDTKEPGNANIQTHVTAPHAPANAQKNSDITKAEIEAKLTGTITTHSHAAGGHTHVIADTTGLQTALDGKQAAGSYAAAAHTHAPADVTGTAVITTDPRLSDARTPTAHNQAATTITEDATHRFATDAEKTAWNAKEPGNANIQAHVTAPHAPAGATVNDTDVNLKNRANHTGTQVASTISDFSTAADARIAAASVNALSDVTVAAPSVGQVLKWNGTAWVNDTDATGGGGGSASDLLSATTTINISAATAPVGGQVLKALSPTSARWDYVQNNNSSTAAQSPFATDTYLTGSTLSFLSAPVVSSTYKLLFDVTKTNVGTATPIITIRIGTAGTIADTARLTFTFGAGTAAADTGCFEIICTFRASGASSVLQGVARLTSNLTVTGLSNAVKTRVATSAAFDSTVANLKIGASYNGGASANHTIQLVRAELML